MTAPFDPDPADALRQNLPEGWTVETLRLPAWRRFLGRPGPWIQGGQVIAFPEDIEDDQGYHPRAGIMRCCYTLTFWKTYDRFRGRDEPVIGAVECSFRRSAPTFRERGWHRTIKVRSIGTFYRLVPPADWLPFPS